MPENNFDDLRQKNLIGANTACQKNVELSNQRGAEVDKLMFNLSTFMIPLSLIALSNDKISNIINTLDKHLILLSWIFLLTSSIIGVISFMFDSIFFDKWAEYEHKRANCFTSVIGDSSIDEYNAMCQQAESLESPLNHSPKTLLIWQSILTGLGMILILIVLSRTLFKL